MLGIPFVLVLTTFQVELLYRLPAIRHLLVYYTTNTLQRYLLKFTNPNFLHKIFKKILIPISIYKLEFLLRNF